MSKRSVVFLDLDMTLWDKELIIPKSAASSIEKAIEKGNLVFLNTGRSRGNTHYRDLEALPLSGMLCACGGHIEYEKKILKETLVPWETVKKALHVFSEEHMPVVVEGRDAHFMNREDFDNDPYVSTLWKRLGSFAHTLSELSEKDAVNKFSCDITAKTDFFRVKSLLSDDFDFIDHNGVVVEIVPKGLSKAKGIQDLLSFTGDDPENVFAFGDSMNDLEMVESAAHGIAMGNAAPLIKEKADFVTTDIHEDGIKNAFLHFGLI